MALLPKKTYSRRNNESSVLCDKEKENMDPFDELLSSPLKQEVQFQPLSFWGKKDRRFECKDKNRGVDFLLFRGSDSDDPYSPCKRKRKPKAKRTESKARTLQAKSRTDKLSDRRKNYSNFYSFVGRNKPHKSTSINKNETLVSSGEIQKHKGWSPDCTLHSNECMEEALKFSHKSHTSDFQNLMRDSNESYKSTSQINSFMSKRNVKKVESKYEENFIKKSCKSFKIYEDVINPEQKLGKMGDDTGATNNSEDFHNDIIHFNKEILDEISFPSGDDSFRFVSVRRHFNYPNCSSATDERSENLVQFKKNNQSTLQLWNEQNKSLSPVNWEFEDVTLINYDNSSSNTILYHNKNTLSTLSNSTCIPFLGEESKEISLLECLRKSAVCDDTDFLQLNDTDLEYFIQELLHANAVDGVLLDSSSTGEDTPSSFIDEETVINIGLKPDKGDSPLAGSGMKKNASNSVSNEVSVLTDSMSELSIKTLTVDGFSESESEYIEDVTRDSKCEDKEKNCFLVESQNVTTKRRAGANKIFERNTNKRLSHKTGAQDPPKIKETNTGVDFDQTLYIPGRASLDWDKSISFINPVFESTRVFDIGPPNRRKPNNRFENESIIEENSSRLDRTYALKPGKKWFRSRSVLKQIQNGTIAGAMLQSTRITGRKFESFVQEMLELQNEKADIFTSIANITASNTASVISNSDNIHLGLKSNKTVLELGNESVTFNDSVSFNETCLEKCSLSHTVKVIQPADRPSAFRNSLGLESNHLLLGEDSVQEESSVSARDFILMQCGQEDVLPFAEYFNERTLENCRKIGEGVYGEVFMCSNTVIKIIPIEGADRVNGEPQKTFAEILSEVVIASKLSNLRKGKKHRTDGFSEMKRCWCVKGKYPKYLLQLWDEYDQEGSGSENDSPIMFKDDQLYIILELGNGGKDLESFVFSSSAQSLSVFIQAAFSLAVAERVFEFEHRDLHWGNVLISETKEKFASVFLDGMEYKIPTKGVKVCIIDFTLSRINHEGCCIFNDLSVDPGLFASEGDYQFEIYRQMLREVKNDWSLFRPKTNLFWLHYTLDKMLKMVRYKNKKAKIHIKHLKDLKSLESVVLEHKDSTDFVLSKPLTDVTNKL